MPTTGQVPTPSPEVARASPTPQDLDVFIPSLAVQPSDPEFFLHEFTWSIFKPDLSTNTLKRTHTHIHTCNTHRFSHKTSHVRTHTQPPPFSTLRSRCSPTGMWWKAGGLTLSFPLCYRTLARGALLALCGHRGSQRGFEGQNLACRESGDLLRTNSQPREDSEPGPAPTP